MKRTVERTVLFATGVYNIAMAAISVFIYTGWFRGQSYAVLERKGLLEQGAADVGTVVYVAEIYGFLIAAIGVVSIIVALRGMKPGTISTAVMIYLGVCAVFSLVTADLLGIIGYSMSLALYWARNKAILAAAKR